MDNSDMENNDMTLPLLSEGRGMRRSQSSQAISPTTGASFGQTAFNTINLFLGVGLLSMPYAIKRGGWLAMLPLCVVTMLFCLSAHLIVAAFDRLPPMVQRSYPELGAHAGGKLGHRLVVAFALVELFGGTCIVLLVIWHQLVLWMPAEGLWGHPPLQLAAILATVGMAPTLLIRNFKSMSWLSLLGFSSSVLVTVVVLSLLPLDPHRHKMPQQPPPGHALVSSGILQSVGIFAVSVSGHSTLPSLRAAMLKPALFPRVLTTTFLTMLAAYAALAAAGYYYFGEAAEPVVTTNLATGSVLSGRALLGVITVDRFLAGLILVNTSTKFPILIIVMQDMILSLFPSITSPRGSPRSPRPALTLSLRFALFAAAVGLSYSARSVLGCVISLVGGLCSISCSLLLPTAFYARLAWPDLRWPARGALCALLAGGLALVASITAQNVAEVVRQAGQGQLGGSYSGGTGGALAALLMAAGLSGTSNL